MNKPLVSVIVPIFNVEPWLDDCVESIVSQSYTELEIILVDDGSTDRSSHLCDTWAERDRRIQVFHKSNEGLGYARNSGLACSHGDYICFVDSDDLLLPTAVEQAVKAAEENGAELISFGCETISEKGRTLHFSGAQKEESYYGEAVQYEFLPRLLRGENCCFSAWSLLYSADLLRRSQWRFVSEREIISEDHYSLLELLSEVHSVTLLPQTLYRYRQRADSLSRSHEAKRFERCCHCYREMLALCQRKAYPQTVLDTVGNPFINNCLAIMKQLCSTKRGEEELRMIFRDACLQDALHHCDYRSMSTAKRLFCILLKHRCENLCLLMLKCQCWKERCHASSDS